MKSIAQLQQNARKFTRKFSKQKQISVLPSISHKKSNNIKTVSFERNTKSTSKFQVESQFVCKSQAFIDIQHLSTNGMALEICLKKYGIQTSRQPQLINSRHKSLASNCSLQRKLNRIINAQNSNQNCECVQIQFNNQWVDFRKTINNKQNQIKRFTIKNIKAKWLHINFGSIFQQITVQCKHIYKQSQKIMNIIFFDQQSWKKYTVSSESSKSIGSYRKPIDFYQTWHFQLIFNTEGSNQQAQAEKQQTNQSKKQNLTKKQHQKVQSGFLKKPVSNLLQMHRKRTLEREKLSSKRLKSQDNAHLFTLKGQYMGQKEVPINEKRQIISSNSYRINSKQQGFGQAQTGQVYSSEARKLKDSCLEKSQKQTSIGNSHFMNNNKQNNQQRITHPDKIKDGNLEDSSVHLKFRDSLVLQQNKLDQIEYSKRLKKFDNYKAFDTSCFSREGNRKQQKSRLITTKPFQSTYQEGQRTQFLSTKILSQQKLNKIGIKIESSQRDQKVQFKQEIKDQTMSLEQSINQQILKSKQIDQSNLLHETYEKELNQCQKRQNLHLPEQPELALSCHKTSQQGSIYQSKYQ